MRTLFDTSVLVAALVKEHPQHNTARPWLEQAHNTPDTGLVSTHTLAELYSVLTRLPRQPKLQPQEVQVLLMSLYPLEKVSLGWPDYHLAIKNLVTLQLSGGIIFDALIAQAAIKAKADQLLTLNPRDFQRLGPSIAALVVVPNK